jgi:hypothetical protein
MYVVVFPKKNLIDFRQTWYECTNKDHFSDNYHQSYGKITWWSATAVFWDITPYSLVDKYQRLTRAF